MAGDEGAGIAIVIPALNEASQIGSCLASLATSDFAEILVSDGGSTDGTCDIAANFLHVKVVSSKSGRGSQLRAGVAATTAPLIVMLHADTRLPPDAAALVRAALLEGDRAGGCFRMHFDEAGGGLRLFAWCTRFDTVFTSFGDQAIFARRDALDGAAIPDWLFLEDVALRKHLQRRGGFVKLAANVETSARRFRLRGTWRGQIRNALVILGYLLGVPVPVLARLYGVERR